jgi:hypothetical protein
MPKAKTLPERAIRFYGRSRVTYRDGHELCYRAGYLAGHRANRLTKAERAVVEAAKLCHARDFRDGVGALVKAVSALERKGRK